MSINRRTVLAGTAGLALAGAATAAKAATVKVTVDAVNSKWVPSMVAIKAGDRVEWTNTAPIPHQVCFKKERSRMPEKILVPAGATEFESPQLKRGEKFTYKFTTKGEYHYSCRLHENMSMFGVVVVS